MRAKRISIPRGSLSPYTASAILQLMREFNRKEDIAQCLTLARLFKEHAAKLKKEPCRQPSKAKKRTEADKRKRAEAFAKIKAGTYIPVALSNCWNEPEKAAATDPEPAHEWQSLDEYKAWIASTTAPKPAQPFKTQAQIDYELNAATSAQIQPEIDGEDEYDSPPPATPAPARPTAQPWTPPTAYEPVPEASGYDLYWARQAAWEAQEAD